MKQSDIDRLVQERCNSSAYALELRLSCTNPSIYGADGWQDYELKLIVYDMLSMYTKRVQEEQQKNIYDSRCYWSNKATDIMVYSLISMLLTEHP